MIKFSIYGICFNCDILSHQIESFLWDKFGHYDDIKNSNKIFNIRQTTKYLWNKDNKNVECVNNSKIYYDRQMREILFCVDEKAGFVIIESLLLEYIIGILSENNIFYLHASVTTLHVAQSNGLILTGDPGSGKTSLMLKLFQKTEKLVADDMVFFRVDNHNRIQILANKMPPRLFQDNLENNFKFLKDFIKYKGPYKTSIELSSQNTHTYCDFALPKYILFLQNDGRDIPRIEKISQLEALKKLIRQIKLSNAFNSEPYLNAITLLIKSCYLFRLEIAKNPDLNIDVIYKSCDVR